MKYSSAPGTSVTYYDQSTLHASTIDPRRPVVSEKTISTSGYQKPLTEREIRQLPSVNTSNGTTSNRR